MQALKQLLARAKPHDRLATPAPAQRHGDIISINNRDFVANLHWHTIKRRRHYMREAREVGKKNEWDIVAIRQGTVMQAGFVSKEVGAAKGMYSLAASLAGVIGNTFLAAFALQDGRYALVMVRDGSVLPGFDRITTRDDAIGRWLQGANILEDGDKRGDVALIAPADFEVGGVERDIYELLTPKVLRREYRVRMLTFGMTRKELMLTGAGVAMAIVTLVGVGQYQERKARLAREEAIRQEQIRLAELERLNALAKKPLELKALEHPWAKSPAALDFAQACAAVQDAVPLSVGGWLFSGMTCRPDGVEVAYSRNGATVADFLTGAKAHFAHSPEFSDDANSAILRGIPVTVGPGGDETLASVPALLGCFNSYFQRLAAPVTITVQEVALPPAPPVPPGETAPPMPVPTWREFAFEYESRLDPSFMLADLDIKPGVRISSIQIKLNATDAVLQWSVKGVLYASK